MVDERGRDKNQICNGGRRRKMKCKITTGLFSRREHHILGMWARPSLYLKI
jgi:hypothetical protein